MEDSNGGYKVKAWDGKYVVEQAYEVIQIQVEAHVSSWGLL